MAGKNYAINSNKPIFSMEDDDMTAAFMTSQSAPYLAADRLPKTSEEKALEEAERRQKEMYQQMRQIEQRTLDSTKRSIGAIVESEKIGIETAEDLVRQREQLVNTEGRLDDINHTLKDSQKNINGIKSVFSSLKQWWTTPKEAPKEDKTKEKSPTATSPQDLIPKNPHLKSAMEASQNAPRTHESTHPALRGLYDDDPNEDLPTEITDFRNQTRKVNDKLDEDLDYMSQGLSRLKGLAQGLGSEISEQNDLLDRIQGKADKADLTIHGQNTQIKQILKKK